MTITRRLGVLAGSVLATAVLGTGVAFAAGTGPTSAGTTPTVQTARTAATENVIEPAETGGPAATAEADGPGGHADGPGSAVDHQFSGVE